MRYVKTIIKALISLSLLAYLIYSADPHKIAEAFIKILRTDGIFYLILSLGLAALSMLTLSVRWKILLLVYNIKVKLNKLYSYYLIGLFFNNFLPTSIGGDIVRIMKIVRISDDKTQGTASVIIERIVGMMSTLIMATLALLIIYNQFRNQKLLIVSFVLLSILVLFFMSIISERIFSVLKKILNKITVFEVGDKLIKLFEAIHVFRNSQDVLFKIVALSFLSQTIVVFLNYSLVLALELPVNLSYLFVVIPVTFLLTMLPSINGIGIREGGYVFLLGKVGVSGAGAISLSFMNLLCFIFLSLIGALLFVFEKRHENINEGGDVFESTL
jgi:uncharacterized protein (TIRG00374 family)